MPIIEDILTAPLKVEKKLEEADNKTFGVSEEEKIKTGKERLASIFKNTNIDALYYGTTDKGELILGYEERVNEKTGKIEKVPIVQEKLNLFDNNNLLEIEVELDPKNANKKDELGLTPEERRRYDKLMAMNRNSGYRSKDEIIRKAKNEQDLDSTIIPEMMMHFLTEEEDGLEELSLEEREDIKRLRRKGIIMEPQTVSGFHKSLKLVSKDKTVHGVMFFRWLTQKGYTLDTLSKEKANELAIEYRKERRPSLELLIDACIEDMETKMCDKILSEAENENEEEKLRMVVHDIRTNPSVKKHMLQQYNAQGKPLFKPDDFTKIEVYLRVYGLNEEDVIQFNESYISNPKYKVTMGEKMREFEENTGVNFIEVYTHWWEKIKKEKEEIDKTTDNPKGISQDNVDKENIANASLPDNIEFDDEEEELDLI